MATKITQIDLPERRRTVLRLEGEMFREDAELLEKIAGCISPDGGTTIVIDLADLSLLDSEAASVLKRLEDVNGYELEGGEIFLQTAVEMAERADNVEMPMAFSRNNPFS
jgi:anti-anti-sigma regulatory factor